MSTPESLAKANNILGELLHRGLIFPGETPEPGEDTAEQTIAAALDAVRAEERDMKAVMCAFCSFEIPTPATLASLQDHVVNVCQEHPLRKMLTEERAKADAVARAARDLLAVLTDPGAFSAEDETTDIRAALAAWEAR